MVMNPRSGKYPGNLIRFLKELDPKATIIDSYEKDPELLENMIEVVTDTTQEEMLIHDFWEHKDQLKYLSIRYDMSYADTKAMIQNISSRLVALELKEDKYERSENKK